MEDRVKELEEKLRKSEQQRQKLKDNLKFFKEKATNTAELLRQHVQLQSEAEKKDCELSELKMARQGLQSQLEAMQATSEATTSARADGQANSSPDSMRLLMARIERVQQTSQDAKAAAQAAAAAARKAEHEAINLQKQNAQLRDRIKDVESRQKASAEELGRMKVQSAALGDREHLKRKVDGLQQQLTAFTHQQQEAHEQLTQWQQAFGAFAQHVAPPLLGGTPVSQEQLVGHGDAVHGVHQGREQGRPLKRICRDSGRFNLKDSSKGSAQNKPGPLSEAEGTAMHMLSGSEGDHISTGTVAGPDGAMPGVTTAALAQHSINPLQECSSSRAVKAAHAGAAAGHHSADDAARHQLTQGFQRGRALESSASGTVADRAGEQPTAIDLVEGWVAQLLDHQRQADTGSKVAAGLAGAVRSDACPVPCVVAGFENALLRCTSARGRSTRPSHESFSGGAPAADEGCAGGLSSAWHSVQSGQHSDVHAILVCAVELSQRLSAGDSLEEDLLTLLEQQLHQSSLQEESPWETDAGLFAAACAHLYRLQSKKQAQRVLLYDMLMAQEASALLLQRISAAATAWPAPLQHASITADDLLGQAALAAVGDLCSAVLSKEARQTGDAETAADTDSGESSVMDANPGVLRAAQSVSRHLLPEHPHTPGKVQKGPGGGWPQLKSVFQDALKKGIDMAKHAEQGLAVEDQWHAIACTVQLAVHCLGLTYCSEKAKEHGILDTLKTVMHADSSLAAATREK